MMHPLSKRWIALLAPVLCAVSVPAAQILPSGSDLSTKDGWRTPTPSVRKPLDADGDFLYGTDGYLMFHAGYTGTTHSVKPNVFANASSSLPGYVKVVAAGATASLASANFARIDNPENPSEDFLSGVALIGGLGSGAEASMFKLVFRDAPARGVRVGVMVNNAANRNPGMLRLQMDGDPQPGATHVTSVGVAGQASYFFFDVTDISNGDSLTLFVTEDTQDKNESGEVRVGGFTFDTLK